MSEEREVAVEVGAASLPGLLGVPAEAQGAVIFAHGSGSSRLSPRNRRVAEDLRRRGFATLLFDLLTDEEAADRGNVFDVALLADRLTAATGWLEGELDWGGFGYFGASTGAAAALRAAAGGTHRIEAVVSRGGRPDLAAGWLPEVSAATLLVVGELDVEVRELNQQAYELLGGERELVVVPGATHLFEEPGALEEVSRLAGEWFTRYIA